jgi:hypothetical protein
MVASVDEWWGFSNEHGWVVLDRNIIYNRPGAGIIIVFLRCSDWNHYLEDRHKWNPPYYVYEPRYIESLSNFDLAEKVKLQKYKNEYRHRKQEFYYEGLKYINSKIHPKLQEPFSYSEHNLKTINNILPKSGHRTSGCWRCKKPVDNAFDSVCDNCGWIICSFCGACSYDCVKYK